MFRNMKLGTKIVLGFGLLIMMATILGVTGYYSSVCSTRAVDQLGHVLLPSVEALLVIKQGGTDVKTAQRTKTERHHLHLSMEHKLHSVEKPKTKAHGFGKSDEPFHRIAGSPKRAMQSAGKPTGKAIPLDSSEDDLTQFNN